MLRRARPALKNVGDGSSFAVTKAAVELSQEAWDEF